MRKLSLRAVSGDKGLEEKEALNSLVIGMQRLIIFSFRWRGKVTMLPELDVEASSVAELKDLIYSTTDVNPEHQKIMGLAKSPLFKLNDSMVLGEIDLKISGGDGRQVSFMLTGTPESEMVEKVGCEVDSSRGEVVNDLGLDFGPASSVWKKLQKHTSATLIHLINPPREGKKLLVLDLDHTLLDFSSKDATLTANDMSRPFLHEFLSTCYAEYDLALWSQTSWRWLELKLHELGMVDNPGYRICFALDKSSMFRAVNKEYVKPLALIYTKNHIWSERNTIHIDDLARNFTLNPKNGNFISLPPPRWFLPAPAILPLNFSS